MKKWLGAAIGIVALLIGLMGGYLLSPEANLWMAEMEVGEALVSRAVVGSTEIVMHLAKTGQWASMLDGQIQAAGAIGVWRHDAGVRAAMATDPRYAILAVEKEHPYFRIANVGVHGDGKVVEVWAVADGEVMAALYETREERMNALLEATAAAILLAQQNFPDMEYIWVFWASVYPVPLYGGEGGIVVGSDISLVGGTSFVAWAENPTEDGLNELIRNDEVEANQYGFWTAPIYCTDSLERLSDDPHPWDK